MEKEELLEKLTTILQKGEAYQEKLAQAKNLNRQVVELKNARPQLLSAKERYTHPYSTKAGWLTAGLVLIGHIIITWEVRAHCDGTGIFSRICQIIVDGFDPLFDIYTLLGAVAFPFFFGMRLAATMDDHYTKKIKPQIEAEYEKKNALIMAAWVAQQPQREAQIAELEEQRDLSAKAAEELQMSGLVWCELLGLHERYRSAHALRNLISYLERGRCDTLKEALNLYEHELREAARDKATAEHRRQMQQQAAAIHEETVRGTQAAEQAARNAEEAAFWGAAATFVAATNAPKEHSDNDYRVV